MSLLTLLVLFAPQLAPGRAATESTPLPDAHGEAVQIRWSDLDGDRDEDVVALSTDGTLRLLRNDGVAGFVDVTEELGLAQLGSVACVAVGDADGDGDVDLVLGRAANVWLAASEGGLFVEAPEIVGRGTGAVSAMHWVDADGDQREDLHVATSREHLVLLNRASGFEQIVLALEGAESLAAPVEPLAGADVTDPVTEAETKTAGAATGSDRDDPAGLVSSSSGDSVVTPTGTGSGPAAMACLESLRDQATGGCLAASSEPMLGMLYPLSADLFVESGTGRVGIGTTTPGYALEVAGQIVSGSGNTLTGSGAAIGGGTSNNATGEHATISGGRSNEAGAGYAVVGGGGNNQATGSHSVVGGGGDGLDALNANVASGLVSTVAGGRRNTATATGASVGGGEGNDAAGEYGTVAGGRSNAAAGVDSMAAGRRAKALHDGAFVWADSTDADFSSTGPDQFLVRASGGMGIGKVPDAAFQLDVEGIVRASDTIVSTKPAGAPFQVASSGLVTNLNADRLDGVEAAAFSQFGPLVDEAELADGAVTDAKVAGGISGTKITANFGTQDVHTSGGIGIKTVEGDSVDFPLHVVGGTATSATGGGYVVVGIAPNNTHIALDTRGIQARSGVFGPPEPSFLQLNPNGGNVFLGTSSSVVQVFGDFRTEEFTMAPGAATGRVLTTDVFGQGTWQSSGWRFEGDDLISDVPFGRIGIRAYPPEASLHVGGGTDASVTGGGYLIVGDTGIFTTPLSVVIDDDEILARNGNSASTLSLNAEGGDLLLLSDASDGSVGIGTGSPQERLDVVGKINSRGANGGQLTAVNPNNQSAEVHLSWLNDQARIRVGGSGAGGQSGLEIQSQGDSVLVAINDASTVLEVNGGAAKPGGGSWSALSDARLKKNVADLEDALETLLRLRGVTFEYIDPEGIGELAGERTGFIAQEVERVLPDWVEEREDGYKQLSIRGFTALAVEALRDLRDEKDREVDELQARIDELRAENAAQGARLEALEGIELELRAMRRELRAALAK